MADLTPGETAAVIVGLVTSIGVSLAGALRFNGRVGKREGTLKGELEKSQAKGKEQDETMKARRSEIADRKAELGRVSRRSLVDMKPSIALAVAEEMRTYEERRREDDERHTGRL